MSSEHRPSTSESTSTGSDAVGRPGTADNVASQVTHIANDQLLARAELRAASLGRSDSVRQWSPLGTIDAGQLAEVDTAGSVSLTNQPWSVDIWIGAEDRWYFMPTEPTVRQTWQQDVPVVETRVRVPGGDIATRAFAARVQLNTVEDSGVVIEVENLTGVPVALAFAVRSRELDGTPTTAINEIAVDGPRILFNGEALLYLSKHPSRVVGGPVGSLATIMNNEVQRDPTERSGDQTFTGRGGVEAVAIVPLPHTAVVKALLPRPVEKRRRSRGQQEHLGVDWHAPEAASVASGWQIHLDAGANISVEDPLVDAVVRSSTSSLLVAGAHGFGELPQLRSRTSAPLPNTATQVTAGQRAALIAEFYHRFGYGEAAEPYARALIDLQGIRKFVRMPDKSDGTLALFWVAASLLTGKKSDHWQEELVGPIAKALHALDKAIRSGKSASFIASFGGKQATISALANLGPALGRAGQPEVAARTVELVRAIEKMSGSSTASAVNLDAQFNGPTVDSLIAIRNAPVGDSRTEAFVSALRSHDPGVLTDANDNNVPTGVWGYDPAAVAGRLLLLSDTAVIDDFEGIDVLHGFPKVWLGRSIEVNGFVTSWGTVSYAVRWHGERAALLWEITPHSSIDVDRATPRLTARSIDPEWEAVGWSGEGLLSPPESWIPEAQERPEIVMEHPDPLEILGKPQRLNIIPSSPANADANPDSDSGSSGTTSEPEVPDEGDSFV